MTAHPPARELLLLAVDHGWSAALARGVDSGGASFVVVKAKRESEPPYLVEVTWHTRNTGTYRFFSAVVGAGQGIQRVSLTKAREAVTS